MRFVVYKAAKMSVYGTIVLQVKLRCTVPL